MSLSEVIKNNRSSIKSALIFFGVLFLLLGVTLFEFTFRNLSTYLNRQVKQDEVLLSEAPVNLEPNVLSIPSLQITAPIVYITEKGEAVYTEALGRGVVHYPGTAKPGEFGNVYLFGHSSDLPWSTGHYKTVFAALPQIQLGERVLLTNDQGEQFVYEVFETKVVMPTDLSVLSQFENKEKLLSIQTSYPLGTALKRFIVLARMIEN